MPQPHTLHSHSHDCAGSCRGLDQALQLCVALCDCNPSLFEANSGSNLHQTCSITSQKKCVTLFAFQRVLSLSEITRRCSLPFGESHKQKGTDARFSQAHAATVVTNHTKGSADMGAASVCSALSPKRMHREACSTGANGPREGPFPPTQGLGWLRRRIKLRSKATLRLM